LFTPGEAVPLPPGADPLDAPLPGVAGVAGVDGVDGEIVPEVPVAGGVVVAPPAAGAQGTAVPLVPVGAGVESVVALPVLRAVVVPAPPAIEPLLLGLPGVAAPDAAGLPLPAPTEAVPASGPASVALLTLPFDDVVVPVELFTWLEGDAAADALGEPDVALPTEGLAPGVACVLAPGVVCGLAPGVVACALEPAPVTGTHGCDDGAAVGVAGVGLVLGCCVVPVALVVGCCVVPVALVVGCCVVPVVLVVGCCVPVVPALGIVPLACVVAVPDCVAGVGVEDDAPGGAGACAANAPTDSMAAKAALLVINANLFFT
jgi:hypothetical protein